MFGYVRVQPYELKVREYECYKAYYCGICKSMGKCTGQCSRFSLNYDSVFLALVRATLQNEKPTVQKKRCIVHPVKKRANVQSNPVLQYVANASAILTYHKCLDDKKDESGFHKLRAFFARLFFGKAYRKAKHQYSELDQAIGEARKELGKMEKSNQMFPPEAYASASAKMVEAVFSFGMDEPNQRIAAAIGKSLGEWVYLVDALDDLASDISHHRFNPLQKSYPNGMSQTDLENYRISLFTILGKLENAIQLIDFSGALPENKEIINNVLYLGLPERMEKILQKRELKEK